MSTPAKRVPLTPVKRASKDATVVEATKKPFLRFHHGETLRTKTLEVLVIVECADDATVHTGQLTDLVLELTDVGFDQFFLQSLKEAKVNFIVQQSAALGLAGVQKLMGAVVRKFIGRMDHQQLLSVCSSIRKFMA